MLITIDRSVLIMDDKPVYNVLVNINISESKRNAFITLGQLKDGGKPLTARLLTDSLAAAGVVYGIDKAVITRLVNTPSFNHQELIAAATEPADGTTARLTYLFPISGDAKPKELPNGSVDFKELGLIKNVYEGEAVCVKTPATPGVPGTNVCGEAIPAQPGRDIPLPIGQGTAASPDGLTIVTKISGQVDLINNRVTVMKQYEIPENVDYNTGNIDFVGNVVIGGDVCAGFTVKAEGNVLVKGSIDGGTVIAKGNITVVNGVKSQSDSKVSCGGDLRCKFLQNANVDADGSLETTSCINSVVRVGDTARFTGSQAMLVASRVSAGKLIETLNIGSKSSKAVSVIEVGINPRMSERASQIPAEITALNSKLNSLGKLISLYRQLQAANRLDDEKQAELNKLNATSQLAEQQLLAVTQEKDEVDEQMKSLGYGTLKVFGTAYAGTQINIGPEKKILTEDYQFTQFVRLPGGIGTSPARR
jgi:uncharacterized protein (DUF342 family)